MPADVTDEFVEALNTRAFGKLATLPDDTQLGWIGPRHLFETDITAEHIAFGRFAHLALRVDRLRVPANVLKSYVRIEEEAALQAEGRDFLNRTERRKAREAAQIRAEQEAKAGGFRRMNSYPVLIDLDHQTAYLGNLGTSLAEKAMHLFSDTFGATLEPATPERVAYRLIGSTGNARALENLPPSHLVRPPDGWADAPADGFTAGDLSFLGKEFLTWLWYQTDADDGPLRVRTGDDVTVMIDKTIRLTCDFGLTGTDVITSDNPTSLPEAKAALAIGKQPTRMGLIVGSPMGEFRLGLDGIRLAISGLALPEDNTEQDIRARIEQRFELTADAANLIDALFELFLQRRTIGAWNAELRKMSTWAAGEEPKALMRSASA
jgi:recombination associated protein RdgC